MALVFLSGVFAAVVALILSDYVRSVAEAPATPLGAGNNAIKFFNYWGDLNYGDSSKEKFCYMLL